MFRNILSRFQLRQSTAFLLARKDDHLLDDIGLTRAGLEALHLGIAPMVEESRPHLPRRAIPVAGTV